LNGAHGLSGIVRALARPKVLRTCQGCGFTWKVPRYYARTQVRAALRAQSRSPLAGKRAREAAAQRHREVTEVSAAYDHCPHCGKEDFSQRRLWAQSKQAYLGIERY
jgi:ribosomal protein L37AE/L43A